MKKNIVTFGEIMMRLQPPNCDRILNAKTFDINFGGGEANVAVCLSELGDNAKFVTKLPDNSVGKACLRELKSWGVDTRSIIFGGERLGVYYCEKGYSCRASNVLYDRKNSSFADMLATEINWETILQGVDWFHFTGITAALSDNVLESLVAALVVSKRLHITVSCDLNYRNKLWTKVKAREVMSNLMKYVDVLIANEEDCSDVFGIAPKGNKLEAGVLDIEGYKGTMMEIKERFNIQSIAITLRESYSANNNGWSALLYKDNQFYLSKRYELVVLDRVGGGDSFGAGLIHALVNGCSNDYAIDYAVACSSWKHTINGDFNIVNNTEIEKLIQNGGSGRVQR